MVLAVGCHDSVYEAVLARYDPGFAIYVGEGVLEQLDEPEVLFGTGCTEDACGR